MRRTVVAMTLTICLLAGSAWADFSVSGNQVQDSPPASSYAAGSQEDDGNLHWFVEHTDITLSAYQSVQISQPGDYYSGGKANTSSGFSAGRVFGHVILVHFDPVGTPLSAVGPVTMTFTLSNGELFLGAISDRNTLIQSDSTLGISGVTYDSSLSRGMDLADEFKVSSDRQTITVSMAAAGADVDEVRILTTPEPTSLLLFGFGVLGLAGYGIRRRRRALLRG